MAFLEATWMAMNSKVRQKIGQKYHLSYIFSIFSALLLIILQIIFGLKNQNFINYLCNFWHWTRSCTLKNFVECLQRPNFAFYYKKRTFSSISRLFRHLNEPQCNLLEETKISIKFFLSVIVIAEYDPVLWKNFWVVSEA